MSLFKKKNNSGIAQSKKPTKKKSGFSLGRKKKQNDQTIQSQSDMSNIMNSPQAQFNNDAFQDNMNPAQHNIQQESMSSMGDDFQDEIVNSKKGFGFAKKSKGKVNKTKSKNKPNKKSGGLFARKKKTVDTGFDDSNAVFNQAGTSSDASFHSTQNNNQDSMSHDFGNSDAFSVSKGSHKSKKPNMKVLSIVAGAVIVLVLLALVAIFLLGSPFGSSGTISGNATQNIDNANNNNSGTNSTATVTVESEADTDKPAATNPPAGEAVQDNTGNNQATESNTENAESNATESPTANSPETVQSPTQNANNAPQAPAEETATNSQPQQQATSSDQQQVKQPDEQSSETASKESTEQGSQQSSQQGSDEKVSTQDASQPVSQSDLTLPEQKQMEAAIVGNPSSAPSTGGGISQEEFMNLTENKIYRDR